MRTEAPTAPPAARATPDPAGLLAEARRLQRGGRLAAAAGGFRAVLDDHGDHVEAWTGLGEVERDAGRHSAAMRALERALALDPEHLPARLALAHLELSGGATDAAAAHLERILDIHPDHAGALMLLAQTRDAVNDLDGARAAAIRAVAVDPGGTGAAVILASLERRGGDPQAAVDRLEPIAASAPRPELAQSVWNELGQARDRLGRYDEAFDAFTRAGVAQRRTAPAQRIDPEVVPRRIANHRRGYTPDVLAAAAADAEALAATTPAPIFLVGFPRSGTTMTEQILASHPRVVALEERPVVPKVRERLAAMLGHGDDTNAIAADLTVAQRRALRGLYGQIARGFAAAGVQARLDDGALLLDKLPLNLIDLGLINAIFPDAKVLVALRDPRDVCLSAFMQPFRLTVSMIHFTSLESTARLYDAVMGLWLAQRDHLALRTLELRYEDTVDDLERSARRMCAHFDLEWDPAVLRFYETAQQRVIRTPSRADVIQPIHRRAVGRWRRYAPHLQGVQALLDPYVRAFGYGDDA